MPKIFNTNKQQKEILHYRISPEHLFNVTSIFKAPIGEDELDQRAVNIIKKNYSLYYESWIRELSDKFLTPNDNK